MPDLVMVSDALTGHHYPTSRENAESDPKRFRVLKQEPLDVNGFPVAPKFKTTVDEAAASTAQPSQKAAKE